MVGLKQTLCALLVMVFSGVAVAQNNTNSPYTRYGYGDLSDQYFGNSKAMGGIAYGLRDGSQINALNPASYTAIDSLTFLFEGGLSLQNMNLSDNGVKVNAKNSSLDYLAMQFRMRRWLAMSIGLLPYSNVGYNLSQTTEASEGVPYQVKSLSGDGGLHQLYVGVGAKPFKNFSIGVNVSYFWGDITRSLTQSYPTTSNSYAYTDATAISVSDYKLDFGVQYTINLNKKHSVTLGAVYSPKHNLKNTAYQQWTKQNISNTQDYTTNTTDLDLKMGIPTSYGAGVTYNYDRRLTIGADFTMQEWSKVAYKTDVNTLQDVFDYCNRTKVSVGAEYMPSYVGRSYLAHIKYRVGGYFSNPYYQINGKRATREYGVTAGFGLPVPRSRSIISLSGQFVRVKGLETNMVNENIFRVSIGLTFNQRWFSKSKVE